MTDAHVMSSTCSAGRPWQNLPFDRSASAGRLLRPLQSARPLWLKFSFEDAALMLLLRLRASNGAWGCGCPYWRPLPRLNREGLCSVDARSTPRTSGFQPGSSVMLSVAAKTLAAVCRWHVMPPEDLQRLRHPGTVEVLTEGDNLIGSCFHEPAMRD